MLNTMTLIPTKEMHGKKGKHLKLTTKSKMIKTKFQITLSKLVCPCFRYMVNYLGSVESSQYKGNIVLCQAVKAVVTKIRQEGSDWSPCDTSGKLRPPLPAVIEISDKGIKVLDKSKFE